MEANLTAQGSKNTQNQNEEINKIVQNMLQKCKIEAKTNRLLIPLSDIQERVAYYTGISQAKINEIQNSSTSNNIPFSIDFYAHIEIFKCLLQFYKHKDSPTIAKLFKHVNKNIVKIQNYDEFKQTLLMLNFDYHTILSDTNLLMEDPIITFQRYSYLNKITHLRKQGTLIYYVGLIYIGIDRNFYSPGKQNTMLSDTSGQKYIFFHAISKLGFTHGLFSYTATESDFYKWIVDILLDLLKPSSLVILENTPLNGIPKSKSASIYDTKHDMLLWLRKHKVPCSSDMNKSQLYKLIKKHGAVEEMSRVERALRAEGHKVLILPTYFECLSPIEMIWQNIKEDLLTPIDIYDEILSYFTNMPVEKYQFYEKHVEDKENELISLDKDMDKALDAFLLHLKNNKSTTIMID